MRLDSACGKSAVQRQDSDEIIPKNTHQEQKKKYLCHAVKEARRSSLLHSLRKQVYIDK